MAHTLADQALRFVGLAAAPVLPLLDEAPVADDFEVEPLPGTTVAVYALGTISLYIYTGPDDGFVQLVDTIA